MGNASLHKKEKRNEFYWDCLIGKTVKEAGHLISTENVYYLNGEQKKCVITELRVLNVGDIYSSDYCNYRVNVQTKDGIITSTRNDW